MKLLKLVGFSLLFHFACSSSYINNGCDEVAIKELINNLDLQVYMASCSDCAPIRNKGYRVGIHPARSNNDYEVIDSLGNKLSADCWMRLLKNNSSSWKTNLLLYNLHDRDAVHLNGMTEEEWHSSELKSTDLNFWQNILQN